MADINKALGKSKVYNINGEDMELKPLLVKDLDIIMKLQKEDTKQEAMVELLQIYLLQAFPESTLEQRGEIDINIAMEVLDSGMSVNGLGNKE